MNTTQFKVQVAYIISTCISVSLSYFIYTKYLSGLNHFMAVAIFSLINVIVIHFGYNYFTNKTFSACGLIFESENANIDFRLKSKTDRLILLHAFLVLGIFSLMLPNLTNYEYAFIFILFSTIGRMAQVPIAYIVLNERIKNYFNYTIGLILCSIGTIVYQLKANEAQFDVNNTMLLAGFGYSICLAFSSVVFKYCTKAEHSGQNAISVLAAEKKSLIYQIFFALIFGCISMYQSSSILKIGLPQIFALVCIGAIVGLAGIITSRLINVISIKTARVLDGYRILISILAYIVFVIFSSEMLLSQVFDPVKVICVLAIFFGTLISKISDKLNLDITGLSHKTYKKIKI